MANHQIEKSSPQWKQDVALQRSTDRRLSPSHNDAFLRVRIQSNTLPGRTDPVIGKPDSKDPPQNLRNCVYRMSFQYQVSGSKGRIDFFAFVNQSAFWSVQKSGSSCQKAVVINSNKEIWNPIPFFSRDPATFSFVFHDRQDKRNLAKFIISIIFHFSNINKNDIFLQLLPVSTIVDCVVSGLPCRIFQSFTFPRFNGLFSQFFLF